MTTMPLPMPMSPKLNRFFSIGPDNPDFPVSFEELPDEFERMRSQPTVPVRPLLVLAGYHAWKLSVRSLASRMNALVGGPGDMYHAMAYTLDTDIPTIARKVVAEVERRWPHGEAHRTTEIDVIAVSMGGLVARTAATLPLENASKRLKIARLFTLATPHRGATLTRMGTFDQAARDMRPGSAFLDRLNAQLPTSKYELICYTRLNDNWVGATNTAPPGREPIWVSGTRLLSHVTITMEPRIIADIARRLRGESPLSICSSRPPMD